MRRPRAGEVVVCRDAKGVYLTEGKSYSVEKIRDYHNRRGYLIVVENDQGRRQGYKPDRFLWRG